MALSHGTSAKYDRDKCRCDKCVKAKRSAVAAFRARPVDPAKHGTSTNYKRGCRCEACSRWAREHNAKYHKPRKAEPRPEPEHGTFGAYRRGCRCDDCRRANRDWMRELTARPVDPDKHGTLLNYHRGCRCELCYDRASKRNRESYRRLAARAKTRSGASAWRRGDRSHEARAAHNAAERRRRADNLRGRFGQEVRVSLLVKVGAGVRVDDAAEAMGLNRRQVEEYAKLHPDFAEVLDAAHRQAAPEGIRHGTDYAYKRHRCRCRECRAAHHGPRLTGE